MGCAERSPYGFLQLAFPLHELQGRLVVLVVDDLETTRGFLHRPVDVAAPGADAAALRAVEGLLEGRRLLLLLDAAGAPKPLEDPLTLIVVEEEARAALANALEDLEDVFEVANVEDRELELDAAEVARALGELAVARAANALPRGDAHARVQDAVRRGAALGHLEKRMLVHIQDSALGNFDVGLNVEGDGLDFARALRLRPRLLRGNGREYMGPMRENIETCSNDCCC